MRYVVDTNVAIIANGGKTNATPECRLCAIDFLEKLVARGRLVVDLQGEVEAEYRSNLSVGQPGVGNRFLQAFFTTAVKRLERVSLERTASGSFSDFPAAASLRKFDRSDQKFGALAIKAKAPVANATDSDWLQFKSELAKHGILVDFLCGEDQRRWFT